MTTEGTYAIEQSIAAFLAKQSQQGTETVEVGVVAGILQSLSSLGYDVATSEERLISIISLLLGHNEWDALHSVAVMTALEDGYISELEIAAILSVKGAEGTAQDVIETVTIAATESVNSVNISVQVMIDEAVAASVDEWAAFAQGLLDLLKEEREEVAYLEDVLEGGWTAILAHVGRRITDNIGERLERFIANAFDVERTD